MEGVAKKQFISFVIPLALTLGIIVAFSVVIAKKRSELKTVLARQGVLEKEVALLKKKNMELHRLRDALVYDPVQVEKEAREQLGYGSPQEKLYNKQYNFPVVDNNLLAGNKSADAEGGIIRKIGLLGVLVLIIMSVTAVFYGTYWYENKYRRVRS